MLNPLCSIIVAAYNEENNVRQCLDCLVNQTYENIEVIIVDDGSIDQTSSIIHTYVQKYSYIKYFYQENAGALAARKMGLNQAKGDFITFLDCDDEFHLDTVEKAMKEFEYPEIDIVLFDLHAAIDATNENFKKFDYFTHEKIIDGKDVFINCIGRWGAHGLGVYRKDIFIKASDRYLKENNQNFVNNDEVVTKLSFYYADKIKLSDAIYLYKFNANSVTRKINKNYVFVLENALIFEEICKKEEVVFNYNQVLFDEVRYIYHILKKWRADLPNKKVWASILKKCLKSILYNKLQDLSFKNKLRFCRMYIYLNIVEYYEK
ncbi:poly-beta-1,6 N-acetyl-D-glucosamine synthase [compost metagenome]